MKGILGFVKTTLIGGVLFLVPIVVIIAIVGKALRFAHTMSGPLAARIPAESIAGVRTPLVVAATLLVAFCFLAGLFSRTRAAKRSTEWLESTILVNIPGYSMLKSLGESVAGVESGGPRQLVLARIEDAWQIAYRMELIEGGHVAVYVPGSPDPMSGSLYFMTEDRIKPLDVPVTSVVKCIRGFGVGSGALLAGRL